MSEKIPCSVEQGICEQVSMIAAEFDTPTSPTGLEFAIFPVFFPDSREFMVETGSQETGSSASDRRKMAGFCGFLAIMLAATHEITHESRAAEGARWRMECAHRPPRARVWAFIIATALAAAPGIIKTPMHSAEMREAFAKLHPVGHMGEIRDVVDAVLFLESAPFATGEILHVDGGQSVGD